MLEKIKNYITGFHSYEVSKNLSMTPKINTVNPHFKDLPRDDNFIKEISETRKSLDGVLSSTDIIKDTFTKKELN